MLSAGNCTTDRVLKMDARKLPSNHTLFCIMITLQNFCIFTCKYIVSYFYRKSENSTPCRETTRAPPMLTPAGSGESIKVGRVQETVRREVDLSSGEISNTVQSQVEIGRTLRLLSCRGQHNPLRSCSVGYVQTVPGVFTTGITLQTT